MSEFEVTDGAEPMVLGESMDIMVSPVAYDLLRMMQAPGWYDLDWRKRKRLIRRQRLHSAASRAASIPRA